MILRVDTSFALPVYEQIRVQVTRMAAAGTLPVGARLPAIRQLASDLGIAKGTVARAYELLEASAVVDSRGSKGTYVRELASESATNTAALAEAAEALVVVAHQSGATLEAATAALRASWTSFGN